ncbi:ABC transporter permease [Clostridium botulinum]|uniref:ABC transporter permease n=1 Tax=Clostridium botulinum (strain Eklund 17B / Type B) TaxID=935198 RepID=B2TJM3_CLOBB|nr:MULTISPECIES: ABC transporter permease [unclassified Clostridium]ACD22574.1 hypothetical protein CLL_A1408 [Clostridium botulinum B str. Eklund 17B (NRP)]MBN1054991.1 ABC transporter permease [Clostridium botulinum]MBY6974777.1 ABC transporter permease [Clostridium botulinum]MBY6999763.1 ABC transporter permease [Clostridium botulinum]MCR1275005.1 ABC transporter permease [Clostridium botulinum]
MYNLLKYEFLKLKSNTTFWCIVLITCFISCVLTGQAISHRSSYLPTDDLKGLFGINIFTQMLLYSKTMAYLEIILGGMFICYDFQHKIVQNAVSSGVSKFKILLSKVIVYYIAMAMLILLCALIKTIGMSIAYKFGADLSLVTLLKMTGRYLYVVLINSGVFSFIVFLAYTFRKPGLTIGIGIIGNKIYEQGLDILGATYPYAKEIENYILPVLSEKLLTPMLFNDVLIAVSISLIHIIGFFLITYYVFKRTELD